MSKHHALSLVAVSAAALVAGPAQATTFTLVDLNTQVRIETDSGVQDWLVNGTDHMYLEAFWYRTGVDNQEYALGGEPIIYEFASDTNANPGADVLNVTYLRDGLFQADVRYSLVGGVCCSNLAEQVTVTNLSGAPLDFTLFGYTDFDIADEPIDDFLSFDGDDTFIQQDGPYTITTTLNPASDAWEIDYYSTIEDRLNDGAVDYLADLGSPLLNGDLTWAASWTQSIRTGGTATFSIDKIVGAPIPLPASVLLLGGALAGLGLVRRRRRS